MLLEYDPKQMWDLIDKFTDVEAVRNGMSMDEIDEKMQKIRSSFTMDNHDYDFFYKWALKKFIIACHILGIVPRIEIQYDEEEKEL